MNALLTITYPRMVANSTGQRIRAYVQGIIQGEQPPVLLLDDGARVEVLYLPDNFTDANCYTPEEAQMLAERIRAASVVVGKTDKAARLEAELDQAKRELRENEARLRETQHKISWGV